MGYKVFIGRVGNWQTGEQIPLYCSDVRTANLDTGYHLIDWFETNIPDIFSAFYTYVASTLQEYINAVNFGIPDARILTPYNESEAYNVYLSEYKCIQFSTDGRIRFLINGIEAYSNGGSYGPCAVPYAIDDDNTYYFCRCFSFGGPQLPQERTCRYATQNLSGAVGLFTFWDGLTPAEESTDPYTEAGESDIGGGIGDFDNTGDNIDFPALPTISVSDTGFIKLFNPSLTALKNLASYMWANPLFDVDGWKKIFANPMDAILGLSIVPVSIPSVGSDVVKVGNISTDISMPVASSQYIEVDCGTLNVNEYWGAYLDYDPYTKTEIYLPYCGIHSIATDDIMGKAVHVKYYVDILSGACCAYIKCGDSVLYTFTGQCSSSIPVTGDNFTNMINGIITASTSIGSMVATGGMSAPMAVPQIASTAVNSFKPAIEKSGSLSGTGGLLAIQTPYLILTRPRQALPSRQNAFIGYPSYVTLSLSDLTGYTEIESIHLENVSATDSEISEIETILKSGVIF